MLLKYHPNTKQHWYKIIQTNRKQTLSWCLNRKHLCPHMAMLKQACAVTEVKNQESSITHPTWFKLKSYWKRLKLFCSNEPLLFIFLSDLRYLWCWLLILIWCLLRGRWWYMSESLCLSAVLDTVHWTHWIQTLHKDGIYKCSGLFWDSCNSDCIFGSFSLHAQSWPMQK